MRHSTAMVNELNAAKRLILSAAADELIIGSLMHISGLRQVIFGLAAAAVTFGIGKLIGVSMIG